MKENKKLLVSGVRVQYKNGVCDYEAEAVHKAAQLIKKETGCTPTNLKISKKSIDARRDISFVYSVYAEVETSCVISSPDI